MKTNVNVTLDVEAVSEAKIRKVPLSKILNEFLREYIGMEVQQKPKSIVEAETNIALTKAKLVELEQKKKQLERERKGQEAGKTVYYGEKRWE